MWSDFEFKKSVYLLEQGCSFREIAFVINKSYDSVRGYLNSHGYFSRNYKKKSIINSEEKKCYKCDKKLPISFFNKNKRNKDGLQSECRDCNAEFYIKNKDNFKIKNNNYYKNNKEKARQYRRNNRKSKKDSPITIINNIVRRAIRTSFKNKKINKTKKSFDVLGCSPSYFREYIESKFKKWMSWDNYGKYNGCIDFGWDLDHIIPISSAKNIEDVIKLNHYSNFQPLCSYVNRNLKRNHF